MKKDQIIILEDRGLISVSGVDSKDFLQNIVTNNINIVSENKSAYSALLSPQGKYLYEFFIIKSEIGYLLECDGEFVKEILSLLDFYKLSSNIKISDISSKHVVGIIHEEKFKDIQLNEKSEDNTIIYRDSPIFLDPRNNKLGARILSSLEKLYLTIKKLDLKIGSHKSYYDLAFNQGVPIKGLSLLKNKLFGLELNLEYLNGVDFKKGCFIGQENTARMKLKNKLRRKLMPMVTNESINIGDEIKFNNITIGRILIDQPYPFALIKLHDPDFSEFKNKELNINDKKIKILI